MEGEKAANSAEDTDNSRSAICAEDCMGRQLAKRSAARFVPGKVS